MTPSCEDLVSFADGELDAGRAAAFRVHLETCAGCQAGLIEAMQLGARLGALSHVEQVEQVEHVKPAPERFTGPPEESPRTPGPPPRRPTPRLRRIIPWAGAALAAAAAVALFVIAPQRTAEPPIASVFAEARTRPGEVRFAYGDAGAYRPMREEMRGSTGSSAPGISIAALLELERRNDKHALALARVWNDEKLAKVAEELRALAPSPSVRSDRAAVDILAATSDNVEPVLTELEALRSSEDPATAHAAQWNYAILLSRLHLPRSAAQAFQAIAGAHEPGWEGEARTRAALEERRGQDAQTRWQTASKAGEALVNTGAPVPLETVREFPGLMRAYFYKAVRTAAKRERVLELASMAVELDRQSDQPLLETYVRQVAGFDFQRRAALATAYAQLLKHAPLTAKLKAELTTPTASREVADIVMGAMIELDAVTDHVDAFRAMVKQAGDPWFELVLAKAEADVELGRSNWLGAEARLRETDRLCSKPAISYQCLDVARRLGKLYEDLHRVPEALSVVRPALAAARSTGEWGRYKTLLWQLADIERFNSSTATARAYAGEILAIAGKGCDLAYQSSAYMTLAGAALLDVDGRAARRDLEAALRCAEPDLAAANFLTDIGRLDPQPDDLTRLQGWLGKLRAGGRLTAAQRVLADEIEGRLVIERDRAPGIALLEGAIAAAATLPRDVGAGKARAGAYSVLIFDAARQRDHARAIGLIAQALGLAPPGACTVGMVAEDERSAVVVRGADGQDRAAYESARRPRAGDLVVSDELARTLDGCAHVQVMALAALQGQPRVLPARLPWSYATGAHGPPVARSPEPSELRSLIVTNVTPPDYLHLAPLIAPPQGATPTTVTLSGPDATPTRVLAAMAGAGEIQFHTHALIDVGVSDASHLVLSPAPDGRYALTAETIRSTKLHGNPIIVLAACHSAQGARYQHAPWSLPDAFLAVGARAVFASATAIPDLDAGPFFADVLARVHAGADPATALRDARTATLASKPTSWVADVIVFE